MRKFCASLVLSFICLLPILAQTKTDREREGVGWTSEKREGMVIRCRSILNMTHTGTGPGKHAWSNPTRVDNRNRITRNLE